MKKINRKNGIWGLGEVSRETRFLRKPFYSMSGVPIRSDEKLAERGDLFNTDGSFWVVCVPTIRKGDKREFKLMAASTNVHLKPNRFLDYKTFCKVAEKDPYLKFIRDFTYLREELFDIAREHAGVRIPFTVDIVRYLNSFPEGTRLSTDEIKEYNRQTFENMMTMPRLARVSEKERELK